MDGPSPVPPSRRPRRWSRHPGLRFDAKHGLAYLDVYARGSRGCLRKRATLKSATREEAIELWREFRAQVDSLFRGGPKQRSGVPTLAEFVEAYRDALWADVKPGTKKRYVAIVNQLLPTFGGLKLTKITTAAINQYSASLCVEEYAGATINSYTALLLSIVRQAVQLGVLEEVPFRSRIRSYRVEKPCLELNRVERAALLGAFDDLEQFRAYLAEVRRAGPVRESPHYAVARPFGAGLLPNGEAAAWYFRRLRWTKPIFVVALETGLRRGDLLDLRWESIDMEKGLILLTTSKKLRRVAIPISRRCREALEELQTKQAVESPWVFLDEHGSRLSDTRIRRCFTLAKRLAKITRRFRFHDLRHTFASTLAVRAFTLGELVERIAETHDVSMRVGTSDRRTWQECSVFSRFPSGALILTGSFSGTGAAVEVLGTAYLAARKADAAKRS